MPYELRARIYPALTAIAAITVFYGIASEQEAALWVTAIIAIIGPGLATVYTRPIHHDDEGG
jgi:hypothetical protein